MFKFLVLAASSALLASAYTTPTTQCTDSCNPIAKPGLNEVVPTGTEYEITWGPTTSGTVTILLDKGPSNNVQILYPIVEKIANSGSYKWTPSGDLEPTGNSGYGLQIVNDADGTFQYSTQFGISNPGYTGGAGVSGSASASASASASGYGNGTAIATASSSSAAAPTGYSNSTGIITATQGSGTSTTLTTAAGTGSGTTASSSTKPTQSGSGATAIGASIGGAFFALMAAAAGL